MLDTMIASALKKLINTQSTFRKRVSVEEQRAQNSYRFLRGRQIAFMIYEYFRATGAFGAVQGRSDLVSMTLQNDDVEDFDARWNHALLSVSEMPSDPILEGLYKSKLQNSAQLRTVMALYDQEVARNNGTPNYQQRKTAVKLHIDQMMRNRNFKAPERCCGKGFSHQESKRKQIQCKEESGRVFSVEGTRTMFQRRFL